MTEPKPVLDYLIRPAKTQNTKAPALILLHGYGSNKEDLFSFQAYLPQDHTVIALEAPLTLMPGGYAWYELHFTATPEKWTDVVQAQKSLQLIRKQLHYLIPTYNLDAADISLIGFSQGAILSWSLGLDYPKEFRRILALSGYIHTDLLKQPLEHYTHILAFASHGTEDPVLPLSLPQATIPLVQARNPEIVFKTYPAPHTINQANFEDLLQWLNQTRQKLDRASDQSG